MNNPTELNLPKQVSEVLDKLEEHGYSAYIHGECVRVLIKGQTFLDEIKAFDFDVMTNADTSRIRAIFDGYNVNEDNIELGELIVTILGVAVSITGYTDDKLQDALADEYAFSFDAIAYSVKKGFFDPFNGLKDLDEGILNFIHIGKDFNPHDILPALAWQSSGEFTISEFAKKLILSNIADMAKPAYVKESRDAKNLKDVLTERNVNAVLTEYEEVFKAIIPELNKLDSKTAEHSYKCVGCSSPVLSLRYALLFHELGKKDCHSQNPNGEEFFYGETERARIYAVRIMSRLGCPEEVIKETARIIECYKKVSDIDEDTFLDFADEYGRDLLKLLLLFNCAVSRAVSDEKTAARFKKLTKGL